jgi:hypothetical protein
MKENRREGFYTSKERSTNKTRRALGLAAAMVVVSAGAIMII